MNGGHFAMGGIGWIYQLLIFAVFFLVVWWLLQKNPRIINDSAKELSPVQILKIRLAKGQISKKQYEDLKKEILK